MTDQPQVQGSGSGAYECPKHGPYGPARFCCACTRESVEAERDRYQDALEQIVSQITWGGGRAWEIAREAFGD